MLECVECISGSLDKRAARGRLGVERVKFREKGPPAESSCGSASNEKTSACHPTMSQQRIQPFGENLSPKRRSLDHVARA